MWTDDDEDDNTDDADDDDDDDDAAETDDDCDDDDGDDDDDDDDDDNDDDGDEWGWICGLGPTGNNAKMSNIGEVVATMKQTGMSDSVMNYIIWTLRFLQQC